MKQLTSFPHKDIMTAMELQDLNVRQANALAKSAQQMDLNEKRLVLLAMSQIKRTDEELLTLEIPIHELAPWIGGNTYQEAQRAADGLLERIVHIQDDHGNYKKFQWTTLSEYVTADKKTNRKAYIKLKFNEELKPLLLQLQNRYNEIPLKELLPIPSFNSQRLYEILWHDSHGGEKAFLSYAIAELKVQLGLRDPDGKTERYKDWRDFKKVLEKAKKDFDAFGALRILNYKGKKQAGRSFTHLLFTLNLTEEKQEKNKEEPKSIEEIQLSDQLKELGYLQNPHEAISKYGFERVKETLKLAKKTERMAANSAKPIYNLGGLIASMLKKGVVDKVSSETSTEPDLKSLADTLSQSFSNARKEHVLQVWNDLNEETQAELHDLMRVELSEFVLKQIEKANWQGGTYEIARNNYLLNTLDDLPEKLKQLEKFTEEEALLSDLSETQKKLVLSLAREQL